MHRKPMDGSHGKLITTRGNKKKRGKKKKKKRIIIKRNEFDLDVFGF